MRITRRTFLIAAAAPLASGIGCAKKDQGRVLVVGGGLAGLVTLDRLVKDGRSAALLEAGSRLGGRIYTLRERPSGGMIPATPLPEGLRAEMGAERVGQADAGMRALLAEFGLPTAPYARPAELTLDWNGRTWRSRDYFRDLPAEATEGLSELERRATPIGIILALVERAPAPAASDPRTGMEWLRSVGMTAKGEEFVRGLVALPLDGMPAAVLHRTVTRDLKVGQSDTIAGGTDRIVEKLAARHSGAITKEAAIASVRQDAHGVVLTDGKGRAFEGSHAVFCLPLAPMRALKFEGGTPPPLAERLAGLEVAYESKFATPHSGAPVASFAVRRVSWCLPETSGGVSVRQTLAWENDAGRPAPGGGWPKGSFGHGFSEDPLIGGAYAYSRSGTNPEGIARAGRLIFAGADLSDAPGWMEGAVRSADQAVAALRE